MTQIENCAVIRMLSFSHLKGFSLRSHMDLVLIVICNG